MVTQTLIHPILRSLVRRNRSDCAGGDDFDADLDGVPLAEDCDDGNADIKQVFQTPVDLRSMKTVTLLSISVS